MLRGLALFLVLPACTPDPAPNATLAELPNVRVSVQLWAARDFDTTPGFVSISYDDEAFRASHNGDCATLGSFERSVTGASTDHVGPGSNDDELDGCYFPGFDLDGRFDASTPTTLVIRDESMTITAEYAADAFAPRVPTLRSANDWTFAAGEQVVIGWPNADDLVGAYSDGPYSSVWFNNDDADDFFLTPAYEGDEIRFAIPKPAPSTGDGLVLFQFGYSVGDAVSCTGATRCSFSAERGYEHRAKITK